MKRGFSNAGLIGIVVAISLSLCFSALAAEKKFFVQTKMSQKMISDAKIQAPGDPHFRISQFTRQDIVIEHTDPNLLGAEHTVYGQQDWIDQGPTGNVRGYTIVRTKDGDYLYGKWEGSWKLVVSHPTNWELESNTKGHFIGGTGKFQNVKGAFVSKGKVTAQGLTEKTEGEIEY